MKNMITNNVSFVVILMLAVCVTIFVSLPNQAQALVQMEETGTGNLGGDPNDEQDFSGGGSSGGYDDEERQDGIFWRSGGLPILIPVIDLGGKTLFLLPSWNSHVPMVKMVMISDYLSPLGDINVR